jgi:superfamily II DNA helicase RecQ
MRKFEAIGAVFLLYVDSFVQSFNRTNLKLSVQPKKPKATVDLVTMIKNNFPGKCGIVYCLSRYVRR